MTKRDGRLRVLIADDHPVYRQGLAEAVKLRFDFELVGEAASGLEALESMRKLEPDVAVLDMKMPGLDGMEVMRAVVEEELASKVLFLSGYLHKVMPSTTRSRPAPEATCQRTRAPRRSATRSLPSPAATACWAATPMTRSRARFGCAARRRLPP